MKRITHVDDLTPRRTVASLEVGQGGFCTPWSIICSKKPGGFLLFWIPKDLELSPLPLGTADTVIKRTSDKSLVAIMLNDSKIRPRDDFDPAPGGYVPIAVSVDTL